MLFNWPFGYAPEYFSIVSKMLKSKKFSTNKNSKVKTHFQILSFKNNV